MGDASRDRPARLFGTADLVTGVRLPLAVLFPLVGSWAWRLGFVALAGLTDLLDGIVARRQGPSRVGAVLDPVADKAFMLSAFVTVVGSQAFEHVTLWELLAILSRDFAAIAAFAIGTVRHWPTRTIPARPVGKLTTLGQFLVLGVLVLDWPPLRPAVRPLVWTTAAVALVAILDYYRAGRRANAAALVTTVHGPAGRATASAGTRGGAVTGPSSRPDDVTKS